MESITYLKNVKVTPKKLRLMLPAIKKMGPIRAKEALAYMQNRPAQALYQAVVSAISNAKHVLQTEENLLQFKTFLVEEGQKLRRYNPGGRGTPKKYTKRYAHVKIVMTVQKTMQKIQKTETVAEPKAKAAPKKTEKKTVIKKKAVAKPKKTVRSSSKS